MVQQIFFYTSLYSLGGLFALLFKKNIPISFICVSAFLWGALFWVFMLLVMIMTKIPITPTSTIASTSLFMMVLTYLNSKLYSLDRDIVKFCISIPVFALLVGAVTAVNYTVMSYDSYEIVNFGRMVAFQEGGYDEIQGKFALWGVFLPFLQLASFLFNLDYLYSFQPLLFCCGLACFHFLLSRSLQHGSISNRGAHVLSFLVVSSVATTYFFLFQGVYIHNSLPSSVYLFLFFAMFWLASMEKNDAWLWLGMLAMLGFSLQRTEAPAIASLFLIIAISVLPVRHKVIVASSIPFTCILVLWYSKIHAMIGAGSMILSPAKVKIIILAVSGYCLYTLLYNKKWVQLLRPYLPLAIIVALTLLATMVSVLAPETMSKSSFSLLSNMFFGTGNWGHLWHCLLGLSILAFCLPRFPHENIFLYSLVSFFLLLYTMAYFRGHIPYRIGWGDSANRILTHIIPVYVFFLTLKYFPHASITEKQLVTIRSRFFVLVTTLFITASYLYLSKPVDLLKGAVVVHAPQFSGPPYHSYHHDMSIALRGMIDEKYVAAAQKGPAAVVLDIGEMVSAEYIQLRQYHATQEFLDYSWQISPDNATWQNIFDTNNSTKSNIERIDDVTFKYYLGQGQKFRYLRLEFRKAKGENRLFLKELKLIQ